MAILVAETADKRLFYLTKPYGREELMAVRETEKFFCPTCRTLLILKIGKIKIPHFAHTTLSDCDAFSEPESPMHLQGKLLLYQFFKDKNHPVELEKYLPEIRQRADLLVNSQLAIEFQCSAVSSAEVTKRTHSYEKIGIRAVWIRGLKEKPAEGIQITRMNAYQQEMFLSSGVQQYFLSLNTDNQQFYYHSNLFYVSGNRWIGKVKGLPIRRQSFPFAVPRRLRKEEFHSVCLLFSQTRRSFIKSQFYAKNRYQNSFWLLCYQLGLDMKDLPETIGVPLLGADCIKENAVLWQLKAIYANREGISMSELVDSGKLELSGMDSRLQAILLLEDYLLFHQNSWKGKVSDALYDIYCKTL